jgi:hypothetical protein
MGDVDLVEGAQDRGKWRSLKDLEMNLGILGISCLALEMLASQEVLCSV